MVRSGSYRKGGFVGKEGLRGKARQDSVRTVSAVGWVRSGQDGSQGSVRVEGDDREAVRVSSVGWWGTSGPLPQFTRGRYGWSGRWVWKAVYVMKGGRCVGVWQFTQGVDGPSGSAVWCGEAVLARY